MNEKKLLYIEDSNKRKLYYHFTPASIISNFVPLVVVLHDEGETELLNFEYKMWNILTPLDNYNNAGLCWLGDKGDFFVKDLLQKLIYDIADEYECEEHIYLYGKGKGGYGAILHGILSKANTVYARNPQLKLNEINAKENNLSDFLNPRDTFPIFYLCEDNEKNNEKSDILHFEKACKHNNIKVDLEHCIEVSNNEEQTLKEILNMLERMSP